MTLVYEKDVRTRVSLSREDTRQQSLRRRLGARGFLLREHRRRYLFNRPEAAELSVVTRLFGMPIVNSAIGTFEMTHLTVKGRRNSVAKGTTDDQIALDIRKCKRNGFLSEGEKVFSWWNENLEQIGAIKIETQPSHIVLRYSATEPGGKSEQIEDSISLDQTTGGPGWKRPWFLCPGCDTRVAILYLGGKYFRCRHCLGLVYRSQQVTPSQRALNRIREIA